MKYLQRKAKLSLYLSVNYLMYIFGLMTLQIGYQDVISFGYKTAFYYYSSMIFLIFIIFGSIFLYLFFGEISVINKNSKKLVWILGVCLSLWILCPLNAWDVVGATGFQIKYITYLLVLLYFVPIYFGMGLTFLRLYKRVPEKKWSIWSIGMGCMIFSSYFVLITIYGISQIYEILIIGMIMIFIAQTFYFIGFAIPSIGKKGSKDQSE